MKTITLDGSWRGKGISPEGNAIAFAGTVPGCVHTDLLREGKIPDPFYRYNADECQWIEGWSWTYEREFELDELSEDAYLCFDGLDVYCDIFLNGHRIGQADDMHIPHRFPLRHAVLGINTLCVAFRSPTAMTRGLPARPGAFTTERLYTRRIQCTYYWDWVNRFVTCGICGSCRVCLPGKAQLDSVYLYTKNVDEYSAQIGLELAFELYGSGAYARYAITDPAGRLLYQKIRRIVEPTIEETVDIPHPQLWYPNGYGSQPLYRVSVSVYEDETLRRELDSRTLHLGIRTVKILQLPDPPGSEAYEKCLKLKKAPHVSGENASWDRNEEFSGFIVLVNGVRIFCKGANWVPCEPFPSAETAEKINALLTLAAGGHANMVRVWGGGIFEQDSFYDACDRLGLLVTQDFLMACGDYPEDDAAFLEHLRLEAEHAAKRLRSHACLAWWSGDNENAMAADENMQDYTGRKSALAAIGPVLRMLDPHRAFLPSSPYGGAPYGSITRGTTHNTNYIGDWFGYIRFHDLLDYREYFDYFLARFCAEEPVMGAPQIASLRRFMTEEDIFGEDDAIWRYHTKNNPAEAFREFEIFDYLRAIAAKLFGTPKSGLDKVFKMQYVQYEWVRLTMELFRRSKWFSSGLIYWMLNDCWPASGWALIDYYGTPKAGYYGFKRASKPLIAAIDRSAGLYRAFACSDSPHPAEGWACLLLYDLQQEKTLWERRANFAVEANCSSPVIEVPAAEIDSLGSDSTLLLCTLETAEGTDRTFFFPARPQDVRFPATQVRCLERGEDYITVQAEHYAHAVSLDGDYVFADNFFSLMPGEARTIRFEESFAHQSGRIDIHWLGEL